MRVQFHRHFRQIIWNLRSLFIAGFAWFVIGAGIITLVEKIRFEEALYFAFITGLTVGYGNITPETVVGRITAVLLAIVGILMSGLVVAAAVQAVKYAWEEDEKTGGGK